jgi:transposase-like protein
MAGDGTTAILLVEDMFTAAELRAAEAAYNQWARGRGPSPDRRQMEARRAAKRLRSYGAFPARSWKDTP